MEIIDLDKHVFKANERGERYLSFLTVACVLLAGLFAYLIIGAFLNGLTLKSIGIAALFICLIFMIFATLVSAWKAYSYALETKVEIDPVRRHFVYTHNRKTIEFDGDDVAEWYDNLGLKIGIGKLTRLTEHDNVMILKSGQLIYLHAWLWEGDHSWFNAGDGYESNIKFYLEAHRGQLNLPESKTARTYKYMFAN